MSSETKKTSLRITVVSGELSYDGGVQPWGFSDGFPWKRISAQSQPAIYQSIHLSVYWSIHLSIRFVQRSTNLLISIFAYLCNRSTYPCICL